MTSQDERVPVEVGKDHLVKTLGRLGDTIGNLPGKAGVHRMYARREVSTAGNYGQYESVSNPMGKPRELSDTPMVCSCGEKHARGDKILDTLLEDPAVSPAARFTQLRMEQTKGRASKALGRQGIELQAAYEQVVEEFGLGDE